MMIPTIHLNGTSGEQLLEQVTEAGSAVLEAMTALSKASPNGRDYYPQGLGAFQIAVNEHQARGESLRQVYNDLQFLAEAISDAMDERKKP